MHNIIGIIGGSGAFATSYLLQKINEYSVLLHKAKSDSDFLHTVTVTTPLTNIDYKGNSKNNIFSHLLENVHKLENFGCNVIVMACNTLHQYHQQLVLQKLNNHTIILNLPEVVCSFLDTSHTKIGVLCSEKSRLLNIYQDFIDNNTQQIVYPSDKIQQSINYCINSVIENDNRTQFKQLLNLAIDSLFEQNVDCVILGCTELSILKPLKSIRNVYDSVELLAIFLNQHFKE